jgi:hypothetical protein
MIIILCSLTFYYWFAYNFNKSINMKFLTIGVLAALTVSTEATMLRRHHHKGVEFVSTLPDVRAPTVTEDDIKAHEAARAEAAKVKRNPQAALLATIRADLEQINNDMSFGVSFSQSKRNLHAQELCTKVSNAI